MNRKRTLSALLFGMACVLYPYEPDGDRVDATGFMRASELDYGRGRFISADEHADVSVVVVTYNSASYVSPLIDDLRVAAIDRPLRVVLVDNQSSDGTAAIVRTHKDVNVIQPRTNLGYAGAINLGLSVAYPCDSLLILNPDLALGPEFVTRLLSAADGDRIGAVVPLMVKADGATFFSLRREPSLTRALGDALLGARFPTRPGFLSEIDARPKSYREAHDVDWATGAALLIPAAVTRDVGLWNEEFFLYSEEIDYFRRIRETGRPVRFEPSAVVRHRGKGSGSSPELAALMAVNRIRYVERHHRRVYSALFRALVVVAEGLRSYRPVHRRTLGFVANRRRWRDLPRKDSSGTGVKEVPVENFSPRIRRGAVIVPAYNEAAVIKRTLLPLSQSAVEGLFELIVVCNGCTDETAEIARSVPGVQVVELAQGSKPGALNAGDETATLWPRLYLDADIEISAGAVLAVLDRLAQGDVLAARPECTYDTDGASALVRSYYRARQRVPQHKLAMWGAGAYGVSAEGHKRFGAFPMLTGDDLYVDTQFDPHEKAVVATEPSVVRTPADAKSLLAILRRSHRGTAELSSHSGGARTPKTGMNTAVAVVRAIRGPQSAIDTAVYVGMALAKRWSSGDSKVWERDESSRSSG